MINFLNFLLMEKKFTRSCFKMTDKVFGLTVAKVQELVNKYNCIITRKELVPVVTVEFLKKECKKISPERDLNKFYKNRDTYHVEYGKREAIKDLLKIVEKEASNE